MCIGIGTSSRASNLELKILFPRYRNDLYVVVCDLFVLAVSLDVFLCKVLDYEMTVVTFEVVEDDW